MALFESLSFMMLELLENVEKQEPKIKEYYQKLIQNLTIIPEKNYIKSLTHMVDSNISVSNRFACVEKAVEEIKNG